MEKSNSQIVIIWRLESQHKKKPRRVDTNIQKLMSFMLGITKYEKKLFDLMIFF